jgi:hypothetical protein
MNLGEKDTSFVHASRRPNSTSKSFGTQIKLPTPDSPKYVGTPVYSAERRTLSVKFEHSSFIPIKNYEYSINNKAYIAVHSNARSFEIDGLDKEFRYTLKLRALSGVGTVSRDATVSGWTTMIERVKLAAPTFSSTPIYLDTLNTFVILFTPGAGSTRSTKFEYSTLPKIGRADWTIVPSGNFSDTSGSFNISNVKPGQAYKISLRVKDRSDLVSVIDVKAGTNITKPEPPNITETLPGNKKITVTFEPRHDGGLPVQFMYAIDKPGSSGTLTWTDVIDKAAEGKKRSFVIDKNLVNGKTYSVSMKAKHALADSDVVFASNIAPIADKPAPPTITKITPAFGALADDKDGYVVLDFIRGSDGGEEITKYKWRATETSTKRTLEDEINAKDEISDNGSYCQLILSKKLTVGATYDVELAAINKIGSSDYASYTVLVNGVPDIPRDPYILINDDGIMEIWFTHYTASPGRSVDKFVCSVVETKSNGDQGRWFVNEIGLDSSGRRNKWIVKDLSIGINTGDGYKYQVLIVVKNSAGENYSNYISVGHPALPKVLEVRTDPTFSFLGVNLEQSDTGGSPIISYLALWFAGNYLNAEQVELLPTLSDTGAIDVEESKEIKHTINVTMNNVNKNKYDKFYAFLIMAVQNRAGFITVGIKPTLYYIQKSTRIIAPKIGEVKLGSRPVMTKNSKGVNGISKAAVASFLYGKWF